MLPSLAHQPRKAPRRGQGMPPCHVERPLGQGHGIPSYRKQGRDMLEHRPDKARSKPKACPRVLGDDSRGSRGEAKACPRIPHISPEKGPRRGQGIPPCHVEWAPGQGHGIPPCRKHGRDIPEHRLGLSPGMPPSAEGPPRGGLGEAPRDAPK